MYIALLNDQGRKFSNKFYYEVNMARSITSAYHPQTKGLDEQTNQTVKTQLSKLIADHGPPGMT